MEDKWETRAGRKLRDAYKQECREAGLGCWICGQPIDYDARAQTSDAFEPDHFHPRSTHPELALDPANLRPSHCSCNRSRRDSLPAPALGSLSRAW